MERSERAAAAARGGGGRAGREAGTRGRVALLYFSKIMTRGIRWQAKGRKREAGNGFREAGRLARERENGCR